jgi:hypothetical protein
LSKCCALEPEQQAANAENQRRTARRTYGSPLDQKRAKDFGKVAPQVLSKCCALEPEQRAINGEGSKAGLAGEGLSGL